MHPPAPSSAAAARTAGRRPTASRLWRAGDPAFLQDVTARAAPILAEVRSWAALESGLAEQGPALTVRGGGFRITDGRRYVKTSQVGPAFSRYYLEKRLGRYPDYRAPTPKSLSWVE